MKQKNLFLTIVIMLCLVMSVNFVSSANYTLSSLGGSANYSNFSQINNVVLTANDTVSFECGSLFRVNPWANPRLMLNESGSSITGNITWTRYGNCTGNNNPIIMGSYNATSESNWTETGKINLSGNLNGTFYVNTAYYNITMQEGNIIEFKHSTEPSFNWAREVANVNLTTGAMINGSLYLMGGNVVATTCTAKNVSTNYGLGIRTNCSNSNAENVWTFYDSFITVNSTSKNGHRYLWQHAFNYRTTYAPYYNYWNGTTNLTASGYTDWDSTIGLFALNFMNNTLTNNTYVVDWDETVTTDFDYSNNNSAVTASARIARGSELSAGTYLFQIIKIIPTNIKYFVIGNRA